MHGLSPRRLAPAVTAFAGLLLAGCTPGTTVHTEVSTERGTLRSTESRGDFVRPAQAIDLKQITVAGFEEAVRANKGKVVLVDCWFLACGPCVKKFPHFVELHRKYAPDGL